MGGGAAAMAEAFFRPGPPVPLGEAVTSGVTGILAMMARMTLCGVSPALEGRDFVLPDDVVSVAEAVLAHRIILDRKAASAGETPQSVIRAIIAKIPVTPDVTASPNGTGGPGRKKASAMAAAPPPNVPNPH